MEEVKKKWYVLRTIGGKENKVKEYIEKEIRNLNLKNNFEQILIPSEKVYQLRKGKKISKERNFFPSYILIKIALVGEMQHILRNIPNVAGFLTDKKGGNPMPVRDNEINRILGRLDESVEKTTSIDVRFVEGESVKIIDGPFRGFTGVIDELNNEKERLKIMVKIFGRKNPIDLSFMQVEKE